MAMGRPPEPVPADKAQAICDWISLGKTLRQWCRENGIHYSTVYLWMEKDKDFAQRFARAREVGHDAIADETLDIIDEAPERVLTENGDKVDTGHVAWSKNRAEQRMKLLAKWNPKKYGEKSAVELTGAEGGPVKVEDTQRSARIAQLLATARTRKLEDEDFGDLA